MLEENLGLDMISPLLWKLSGLLELDLSSTAIVEEYLPLHIKSCTAVVVELYNSL